MDHTGAHGTHSKSFFSPNLRPVGDGPGVSPRVVGPDPQSSYSARPQNVEVSTPNQIPQSAELPEPESILMVLGASQSSDQLRHTSAESLFDPSPTRVSVESKVIAKGSELLMQLFREQWMLSEKLLHSQFEERSRLWANELQDRHTAEAKRHIKIIQSLHQKMAVLSESHSRISEENQQNIMEAEGWKRRCWGLVENDLNRDNVAPAPADAKAYQDKIDGMAAELRFLKTQLELGRTVNDQLRGDAVRANSAFQEVQARNTALNADIVELKKALLSMEEEKQRHAENEELARRRVAALELILEQSIVEKLKRNDRF